MIHSELLEFHKYSKFHDSQADLEHMTDSKACYFISNNILINKYIKFEVKHKIWHKI